MANMHTKWVTTLIAGCTFCNATIAGGVECGEDATVVSIIWLSGEAEQIFAQSVATCIFQSLQFGFCRYAETVVDASIDSSTFAKCQGPPVPGVITDCNFDGLHLDAQGAFCASAATQPPANGVEIVRLESFINTPHINSPPGDCPCAIVSFSSADIQLMTDDSWSASASGSISPKASDSFSGILRQGIIVDGQPHVVFNALCGNTGIGVTFDELTDTWTYQQMMSGGPGMVSFSPTTLEFRDVDFDVNEDGRFNALDIQELADNIGTMDANFIARWDIDQDGAIDQDDVDFMQMLIDAGLDSGVFGDADGDGDVDCTDRDAMVAAQGLTLCDEGYNIALDANVNGVINQADLNAMDAIPPSPLGDIDKDGDVDGADLSQLLAAWETSNPDADLNDDGVVNGSDLATLLANWGATCN